jgi:L-ascorbate metabolism protein UlaG (beta-lactamase superfamily)
LRLAGPRPTITGMAAIGGRTNERRLERVKASPRFDGSAFVNTHPAVPGLKQGTALPTLREYLCGGQRRTPNAPLPTESPLEQWRRGPETGLRATWLGHSTVFVEIDGVRLLTDPVWGERASPVSFAGPKRFDPVPVPISALPRLDAVLISHDHYDHLDRSSVTELARRHVRFITSLGVGGHLEAWGVPEASITELDWWEHTEVRGVRITATPSQHFSGRSLGARNQTAWSSFFVQGPRHSVFFSGDTGLTPEYSTIRERLGCADLVMLEVGAFHPAWGDIHLGPENALRAHELLGGGAFLPVHWGTFNLAMHAWDEPAETLLRLAPTQSVDLVMPKLGEAVEPARAEHVVAWWRAVGGKEEPTNVEPRELQAAEAAVPWPLD